MSKVKKDTRKSEEHSSFSSCTSSSSDEEVDARDLKPIKEYLSNRKELARQLFKSVKSDKIRMMLPQVLKQIDLNELEQWCVSELSGMSKTRIMSILNDKPMLESSDTSESEDSGPSLEIISDTEEWLTDDDACKKEDDGKKKLKRSKIKVKGKSQVSKTGDIDKSNAKGKFIGKTENDDKIKDIKIKKEDSKDKDKEKEGDSLLDLLELEMRARAIRALIRKEEDVIPSSNSSQTNNSQAIDKNNKILQDDAIAKEDCRKQLERIINAKQGNIGEDEDVVLVVQPTPVVELLSSESDGENNERTRANQKKNKRATEPEGSAGKSNEDSKNSQPQDSKEKKETQEVTASQNNTDTLARTDLSTRSETKAKMSERNVDIKNNILSISISADNVADKRKKSKRRLRTKQVSSSSSNTNQDSPKSKRTKNIATVEQSIDTRDENINEQSRKSPISEGSKVSAEQENSAKEKSAEESKAEKDRSADSDEIIDLDDYCDVMEIDNGDDDKSEDNMTSPQQDKQPASQAASSNSQTSETSSETWASRYYQTDDVQNVIKESKIQSEIRKRLRERQRLSKLSKSPSTNLSSQTTANQAASAVSEKAPTGSVEEYLALKRATSANISANNNDSNNATAQDNPATVSSNNDIKEKENSVQNESIASHSECTDSTDRTDNPNSTDVAAETNCLPSCLSTGTAAETAKEVLDAANDNQLV